jgi:long-chain acyl-CoA synthetase
MEQIWIKNYDEGFPSSMDYPDKTLYELFREAAIKYPDFTACSFLGTKISFKTMLSLVDQSASALQSIGLQKGDIATICLPNMPQAVVAFYALNRIGVIANMAHPLTPAEEMFHNLQMTKSTALFVLDAFLPKYTEILPKTKNRHTVICSVMDYLSPVKKVGFYLTKGRKIQKIEKTITMISWKELLSNPSINPYIRSIEPGECALYLHSGGTMGNPKTIMLSSLNLNTLALQGPFIVGIKDPAGCSMATILPLFHGFGLCMGMHTMMVNGITAILVPQFSTESLVELLKNEKPNFIAAVPTLLEGIMKNKKIQNQDLSYLKAVFCGGDTLTGELKTRFDQFLADHHAAIQVREGYGLTETVTVCSVNPIKNNKANTVGLPLADMLMTIVESGTDKELPVGSAGEICVTGPTLMLGYLNDPVATKETVHVHADGRSWVHTGDFGFMDEDGFFHFTQRIKRIIKVSGIPVFPSQIEDVIAKIPGIREVSVIGIPHPYKMQVVKAFVVLDSTLATPVSEEKIREEIQEACMMQLIKHAVPTEIVIKDKLPRTKVGKIDTVALEKESAPAV